MLIETARTSDAVDDLESAIAFYDIAERAGSAHAGDLVNYGVLLAELCSRGPAVDPELTDSEARYIRGRWRSVLVAASKGARDPKSALEAQFWLEYWAFILDSEAFDESKWLSVIKEKRSVWPVIYFGPPAGESLVAELVQQVASGGTAKLRYARAVAAGWT